MQSFVAGGGGAAAAAGSGDETSGTDRTSLHFGQWTFLPASDAGIFTRAPHVQGTTIESIFRFPPAASTSPAPRSLFSAVGGVETIGYRADFATDAGREASALAL